jgi:RNA polymerase sigma factor (sigma-70 family)
MNEQESWAQQFEQNRGRVRAVGYRMLGSLTEADDAVQEAWLRLNRSDASAIENLGGWLTRVVARVCLDMLRARASRREEALEAPPFELPANRQSPSDPEQEVLLADSVGLALLVVLDRLTPAERIAFVLHDMFAMSFDEIASIIRRTPTAARQLASRARRRVQGADKVPGSGLCEQRKVVGAFVTALRGGDFEGLIAVLDPDVIVRADSYYRTSGPANRNSRCQKLGQGSDRLRADGAFCTANACRWLAGTRMGPRRSAIESAPLHDQGWQNCPRRGDRRSRAAQQARSGRPR